jgi:RHS repeat-associated protein
MPSLANDPSCRQVAIDALGRLKTRLLSSSSSTDTYSYAGTSEKVVRIANSGGVTTDSVITPAGDRLGVKVGATVNWFVPDLHGNVAASLIATEASIANLTRYDAYGKTIATWSGTGGSSPVGEKSWKYQGRLDVSPTGLASPTPLYDMSARYYSPGLGAFTSIDSVMGGAQNPLSLNRYLYALANPATLQDPSGHYACSGNDPDCKYLQQSVNS